MKKLELKCPVCNSTNARQWAWEDMHFFDNEFYEYLKEEFGENADTENYYTAKCICDDCNNRFDAKVVIEVQVVEIRY